MFWNVLGAFSIGWLLGSAAWLVNYWVSATPPWFLGGIFYSWVLFIGLAVFLLVLGLWAGGVVSAIWLAYAAAGIIGALAGAFTTSLWYPIVANLSAVVSQIAQLIPKP